MSKDWRSATSTVRRGALLLELVKPVMLDVAGVLVGRVPEGRMAGFT